MKFLSEFKHFHSRKCTWNSRLRNGVHFVSASIYANTTLRHELLYVKIKNRFLTTSYLLWNNVHPFYHLHSKTYITLSKIVHFSTILLVPKWVTFVKWRTENNRQTEPGSKFPQRIFPCLCMGVNMQRPSSQVSQFTTVREMVRPESNIITAAVVMWDFNTQHNIEGKRKGQCLAWTRDTKQWSHTWWRHQMETFTALLARCEGNPSVTGGFPSQRPVTRSFCVFFGLRMKKRLSKQSRRRWFQTPFCSLCRHCNAYEIYLKLKSRGTLIVHYFHTGTFYLALYTNWKRSDDRKSSHPYVMTSWHGDAFCVI